ncbi:hypothetical protein GTW51_21715 [Aurantimonas aggregata]|uniref:Uncharacterized protein n=1 Tax=Aurantimonas aggregata TaxID=2047720 RepID=A0A6L9MN83_9HYPH|nr:hypothetical protein [Aurantimonas aggregata]NDV89283.1 hypothetical protein [Aurantimonas aggregata]
MRPDISFDAQGYYAFAFEREAVAGKAFNPSAASYTLPFDRDAVLKEDGFDYEAYQNESVLTSPAAEEAPKASSD